MAEHEKPKPTDENAADSSRQRKAPPGMRALLQANTNGTTDPDVVPMTDEEKAFAERLKRYAEKIGSKEASGPEQFINRSKPDGPSVG